MTKNQKLRAARLLPGRVPRYVRCYDNGGETSDRYTACYTGNYRKLFTGETLASGHYGRREWFQHVCMSGAPFHPQGIGMHGEHPQQIDVNKSGFAPAIGRKNHLGTRIRFQDLPADCQKLVLSDYKELWDL
jgi:hypothetical protein